MQWSQIWRLFKVPDYPTENIILAHKLRYRPDSAGMIVFSPDVSLLVCVREIISEITIVLKLYFKNICIAPVRLFHVYNIPFYSMQYALMLQNTSMSSENFEALCQPVVLFLWWSTVISFSWSSWDWVLAYHSQDA